MEVFEFSDQITLEVYAICGWWPTFVGLTSLSPRRGNTTQRKLTAQKEESPPTEEGHRLQYFHENVNFCLYWTCVFVRYLGFKMWKTFFVDSKEVKKSKKLNCGLFFSFLPHPVSILIYQCNNLQKGNNLYKFDNLNIWDNLCKCDNLCKDAKYLWHKWRLQCTL